MIMTREDAIVQIESLKDHCEHMAESDESGAHVYDLDEQALDLALAALHGPTREMVERMRGEWVMKHRHHGGFRRVTGMDDMGEQHTITIDERCEYDDRYCSKCGKQAPDNFLNFCSYCGQPKTDEAVQMVMERMEALKDGKGDG